MKEKKYKIKLLDTFRYELFRIYEYIYYDLCNPIAANSFIINVNNAIIKRNYFPKSFQKFKSKNLYEWYRIYIGNFTIFYVVENNEMIIAHIIYSARNLDNLNL